MWKRLYTHKKVAIKVDKAPKAVIFEEDSRSSIETAVKAKFNPQLASELKNEDGQWHNLTIRRYAV